MTDTERRKKLVKWLDEMLKTLRALTVSTFVDAIEELREYIEAGGDFSWDAHGIHERNVMNLLRILEGKINLLIGSGVSRWYQEGLDNATEQVSEAVKKLTKSNRQPYGLRKLKQQATEARRMEAVAGHAETVSYRGGAMNNLSNRVWDFKDDSKKAIEQIVQDAIKDGKGVNETKNSVKEFLNTDGNGKMKHGGEPGVYKNPEKNCERLMRTEVNAAYRSAEIDSYNAMDVVLGYEIHLSGNHTTTRKTKKGETKIIHIKDICDECAGKYPKNFVWFGWHPNCRCYITPITMTPAQFGAYMDAEDEGREKEYLESIMIKDFPDGFKKYFGEHSANIARAAAKNPNRKLPSWFENNKNILPTIPTVKPGEGKQYLLQGHGKQPPQFVLTKTTEPDSTAQSVTNPATMQQRLNDFNKYNSDPDYTNVQFDPKTGGLMATHKQRKKHKHEKTPLGLTPTQLEDFCQLSIYQMGGSCIIQNEKSKRPNGQFASALDAKINGELMDIRSVCTPTTKIINSLTDKHSQLISFNKDRDEKASALCLYFHIPEWYNEKKLEESITSYKKICKARKETPAIKKLVVILKGHHSPIEVEI